MGACWYWPTAAKTIGSSLVDRCHRRSRLAETTRVAAAASAPSTAPAAMAAVLLEPFGKDAGDLSAVAAVVVSTEIVCITVVALSVVMPEVMVSVIDVVVTDVVVVVVAETVFLPVVPVVAVVLVCVVEGGVGQSASNVGVTVLSSFGTNAGIKLQR